jgi:protein-L-isoaspartate(D-aspartate) O-methyltransferase
MGIWVQYTDIKPESAMWPAFARFLVVLLVSPCLLSCNGGCPTNWFSAAQKEQTGTLPPDEAEFTKLRERMVRDQLRTRDITDPRVLAAMLKVPRHEFVPREFIRSAYDDGALPLGMDQTISQPYIVAYMTQALELHGRERVLEIGTGSGYQSAILTEIPAEVYTIEIIPQLQEHARAVLGKLGYHNIHFRIGDGYMGWLEYAPFDRIIVTAAPEDVPQPLLDQLSEGGRLIIPIGSLSQELVVFEKEKSRIKRCATIPVRFVPMTGKAQEK